MASRRAFTSAARWISSASKARAVAKTLDQGASFAATARKLGRDASKLPDGYLLGDVVEGTDAVPGVPATP